MALTINNFWGAETGGLEEASSVLGVSASASTVRSGGYSYFFTALSDYIVFDPFESVADAGTAYVIGFALGGGASGAGVKLAARESGSSVIITLGVGPDGDWTLDDSVLTRVGSGPTGDIDTASRFAYLELYFQKSGSGSWALYCDGVLLDSGTGADFDSGAAIADLRFSYFGLQDSYVDDIYFMSGATSSADRLGGCEVYAYRSHRNSYNPDTGDQLNVGNPGPSLFNGWEETQEVPFDDTGWMGYDGALSGAVNTDDLGGSVGGGPNTDANITGTIPATKGVWRVTRGNGGATDHYGLLGNNVDGTTRTVDLDPPSSPPANYTLVSESASIVPAASEYCQIGFECTGPQDLECYDMLAQVLHVPAVGGGSFPPINHNLRVFQHLLTR